MSSFRRHARLLLPVLLAWMLGHLAGRVHELHVQHVLCPEHGAWMDVSRRSPGAGPTARVVAPRGGLHHDGCGLLAAAQAAVRPVVSLLAWEGGATPDTSRLPPTAPHPRSVLDYAPKRSPSSRA